MVSMEEILVPWNRSFSVTSLPPFSLFIWSFCLTKRGTGGEREPWKKRDFFLKKKKRQKVCDVHVNISWMRFPVCFLLSSLGRWDGLAVWWTITRWAIYWYHCPAILDNSGFPMNWSKHWHYYSPHCTNLLLLCRVPTSSALTSLPTPSSLQSGGCTSREPPCSSGG